MHLNLIVNGTTGAGNGKPSTEAHGVPIRKGVAGNTVEQGFGDDTNEGDLLVEGAVTSSTAGTIGYVRLWAWYPDAYSTNKWFPAGDGADADKDGGVTLEEARGFQFFRWRKTFQGSEAN